MEKMDSTMRSFDAAVGELREEKSKLLNDLNLTECQERLSAKLEEIHLWQEKDRKIMKEFDNIVGERNQFYDDLKRIFKRKIKRHKRGHGGRRKDGDGNGD